MNSNGFSIKVYVDVWIELINYQNYYQIYWLFNWTKANKIIYYRYIKIIFGQRLIIDKKVAYLLRLWIWCGFNI